MKPSSIIIYILLALFVSCKPKADNQDQVNETQADSVVSPDIESLSNAIREDPKNANNFYLRALEYANLTNYIEAVRDIDIAMQLDSTRADFYTTQSDLYLLMGRPDEARAALVNGIDLFPRDTQSLLKLGEFYYYLKDFLKAQQYINLTLDIDKFNDRAYFFKGLVYLETEDTTRAIQSFQRAIEFNPDDYDSYMMLGNVYGIKHDSLAVDYYNNAIDIRKNSTEARYKLAMFLQNHNDFSKAIAEYSRIIEIEPAFKNSYYNTGYIYLEYLNQYQMAIPFFQKAYEIDPEYADAVYNEGLCYEYMKNYVKARELYIKSIEIVPNYSFGIRGLNRLDELEKK